MKKIQYEIKNKAHCKFCGHSGIPHIKMVTFKNSKEFSCSAICPKCGKWIENVPMKDVKTRKYVS